MQNQERQYSLAVENATIILLSRGQVVPVEKPTEYVHTTLMNKGVTTDEINELKTLAQLICQDYNAEQIVNLKSIKLSEPLALVTFGMFKEIEAFVNTLLAQR